MGRLYELVTRHFLATLSHDARFLQTKVLLSSTSGENFTVAGKIMIDPGYLAVLLQSKVRKWEDYCASKSGRKVASAYRCFN